MPQAVLLENVSREFGHGPARRPVVDSVSLSIPEGQFLSIMGPSGCGKSTLLNLIGGLDEPTAGTVVVCGKELARLSEEQRSVLRRQHIGIVFQNFNLLPRITVIRNVAWRLSLIGVYGSRARQEAARALDQVGVPADVWERHPADLSGGEQQRVAIARALATRPKLLLADEPTGNLDTVTGEKVLTLLQSLNRDTNMSVVLVTHDAHAGGSGQRTIQMRDGQVIRDVSVPPPTVTQLHSAPES